MTIEDLNKRLTEMEDHVKSLTRAVESCMKVCDRSVESQFAAFKQLWDEQAAAMVPKEINGG